MDRVFGSLGSHLCDRRPNPFSTWVDRIFRKELQMMNGNEDQIVGHVFFADGPLLSL